MPTKGQRAPIEGMCKRTMGVFGIQNQHITQRPCLVGDKLSFGLPTRAGFTCPPPLLRDQNHVVENDKFYFSHRFVCRRIESDDPVNLPYDMPSWRSWGEF